MWTARKKIIIEIIGHEADEAFTLESQIIYYVVDFHVVALHIEIEWKHKLQSGRVNDWNRNTQ